MFGQAPADTGVWIVILDRVAGDGDAVLLEEPLDNGSRRNPASRCATWIFCSFVSLCLGGFTGLLLVSRSGEFIPFSCGPG
jgi:hypothetical protein